MKTTTEPGWANHARDLADLMRDRGDLISPEWHDAFAEVPRHVFVPRVFEQDATGHWFDWDTTGQWDRVYSTRTLVTALDDRHGYPEPASSSTNPELMARMLEMLDVRDGHRVLEVGTGTGYNAALLSHRLGAGCVFSVDVDREFVDLARQRLASLGYVPTLVAADGEDGLPAHGPYDRIIATCAVPAVPRAWADQLSDIGSVLVDLKPATSAGNLVHLHKQGSGALEGRFAHRMASFMAMRHDRGKSVVPPLETPVGPVRTSRAVAPSQPWDTAPVVWFLAQLCGLPRGVRSGLILDSDTRRPVSAMLTVHDGSRVTVDLADGTVTEVGGQSLWEPVEAAYEQWLAADCPGWDRFGLSVDVDGTNRVWLDEPEGRHSWFVPDAA